MTSEGLSARRWRRLRAQVLAVSTLCHLCGHEGAGEGDHLLTRAQGGAKYDLANVAPAHGWRSRCYVCDPVRGKACNQSRGAGGEKKRRPVRRHAPLVW